MSKVPSLQFYPGDWRKDPGVQSLSYEERGVWFEMLMIMHDSNERGKMVLNGRAMTEDEMATLLGLPSICFSKILANLLAKGVAKIEQNSSKIYNARMVRDETARLAKVQKQAEIRKKRQEAGRKGGLAKAKQRSTLSSSSISISEKNPLPPTPKPELLDVPQCVLEAFVDATGSDLAALGPKTMAGVQFAIERFLALVPGRSPPELAAELREFKEWHHDVDWKGKYPQPYMIPEKWGRFQDYRKRNGNEHKRTSQLLKAPPEWK